jgi:hypothetical protein
MWTLVCVCAVRGGVFAMIVLVVVFLRAGVEIRGVCIGRDGASSKFLF